MSYIDGFVIPVPTDRKVKLDIAALRRTHDGAEPSQDNDAGGTPR